MTKVISADIECRFDEFKIDFKNEVKKYNLNPRTEKLIVKAFGNGMLDGRGEIWLSKEGLHHILRKASKKETSIELRKIKSYEKEIIKGEEFVKVSVVNKYLLDKTVTKPNNEILKCILTILAKLPFDVVVENQRQKYQEYVNKQLKKLRDTRIKEKKIKVDELTGERLCKLGKNRCEFHHVKARNINGNERYELDIELGLIVNKNTHNIITAKCCNDEDDLYELCLSMGSWKLDWYNKVKDELSKYRANFII